MKKLMLVSAIVLGVGLTLVLVAGILASITSWGGGFNPTAGTPSLVSVFSNIGYLAAVLAGVTFVSTAIATAIRGEDKDKENKK
ncbi:MAG: hypothetical protein LBN07_04050 [Christensenellaceae bacterium]|jgi:hypothetical protein|nr:hypothetical protein [Christensenellaceae bacterium]